MTDSAYGIVLVPDTDTTERCNETSGALHRLSPSEIVLDGETSHAHITIVHVHASLEEARALWEKVQSALHTSYEAEAFTFYIRPAEGTFWNGFDVRKTPELTACHNAVMDLCDEFGVEVTNEHRDKYWPHLTLGRWAQLPDSRIPVDEFPLGTFRVRPALARMGEHGTVTSLH